MTRPTEVNMVSKTNAQQRQAASKQSAAKEPADRHADASARVLRRFRVVFNAVKTHFRAVERTAGVSGAQVWAMSVVYGDPGIGVGGLARAMDIHQSTASNLLRALTEAGMVVSSREAEDRRAVQLYLTAKGQKVLAKVPGPFAGLLPDALNRLDDPTLARLDRDLTRLIRQLGADARGASVPLGDGDS
jgi:DNA-binding MarR family transcriptional regulator